MHNNAIFVTREGDSQEIKVHFDDSMNKCGIMGVAVFITSYGTPAEIMFVYEL